ncbi:uncharacterized protein LOC122373640 isoform X1 [Amphibalanus amphitrite]|uniref:uncharacterized protein LOC122373640 isoform X1 n=1 Tax=Amphibalanus amphitrite TaxID=1232801 RepID=UPI001C8FA7A9|nr:uncharacterized protein LOC122373640 isoform X1 [Amphibalanus amphitrite]
MGDTATEETVNDAPCIDVRTSRNRDGDDKCLDPVGTVDDNEARSMSEKNDNECAKTGGQEAGSSECRDNDVSPLRRDHGSGGDDGDGPAVDCELTGTSPVQTDGGSESVGAAERPHSSGWLVDEPAQLSRLYRPAGVRPDRRLWRIATPFLMDQQAAAIAREMETGQTAVRRRRRPPPPQTEDPVTAGAARLLTELRSSPSGDPTPSEYRENNSAARRAAREVLEGSEEPLTAPRQGGNPTDEPCLMESGGHRYVLPARSAFLCGDVTAAFDDVTVVSELLGGGPKFDSVLLDPPWSNRFVRRKRKLHGYRSLEAAELASLPLPRLAAPGALVAVWCTNSSAQGRTLRHTLLPAWGVREIALWHWVKVTRYGQPITSGAHHSKQPYEQLVLGRLGAEPAGLPLPPAERLIVSVPCAVHSRKPLLHDLLRPYLPAGYRGLEVFARGLAPGWTAWGDQPLLLQRVGGLLVTQRQAEEVQQAEEARQAEKLRRAEELQRDRRQGGQQ